MSEGDAIIVRLDIQPTTSDGTQPGLLYWDINHPMAAGSHITGRYVSSDSSWITINQQQFAEGVATSRRVLIPRDRILAIGIQEVK